MKSFNFYICEIFHSLILHVKYFSYCFELQGNCFFLKTQWKYFSRENRMNTILLILLLSTSFFNFFSKSNYLTNTIIFQSYFPYSFQYQSFQSLNISPNYLFLKNSNFLAITPWIKFIKNHSYISIIKFLLHLNDKKNSIKISKRISKK